jgi:hypothetical protein
VVKGRQALGHDIDRRRRIGRALRLTDIRLQTKPKREEKRGHYPTAEPGVFRPRGRPWTSFRRLFERTMWQLLAPLT